MKKSQIIAVLAIFILAGMINLNAQQGQGPHNNGFKHQRIGQFAGIPNLTEDQQKKIADLRVTHQKEMLALRNQMGELKAKQNTLSTADKPDMKAINANIDEITKLQNQILKNAAEHKQQVRSLLTDEQRLWFDTHHRSGFGKGQGMGGQNGGRMWRQERSRGPMQQENYPEKES